MDWMWLHGIHMSGSSTARKAKLFFHICYITGLIGMVLFQQQMHKKSLSLTMQKKVAQTFSDSRGRAATVDTDS